MGFLCLRKSAIHVEQLLCVNHFHGKKYNLGIKLRMELIKYE